MQQVHVDALILDCGMDFDGNGDKTEGKNPVADRLKVGYQAKRPSAMGESNPAQRDGQSLCRGDALNCLEPLALL